MDASQHDISSTTSGEPRPITLATILTSFTEGTVLELYLQFVTYRALVFHNLDIYAPLPETLIRSSEFGSAIQKVCVVEENALFGMGSRILDLIVQMMKPEDWIGVQATPTQQ